MEGELKGGRSRLEKGGQEKGRSRVEEKRRRWDGPGERKEKRAGGGKDKMMEGI